MHEISEIINLYPNLDLIGIGRCVNNAGNMTELGNYLISKEKKFPLFLIFLPELAQIAL